MVRDVLCVLFFPEKEIKVRHHWHPDVTLYDNFSDSKWEEIFCETSEVPKISATGASAFKHESRDLQFSNP